MIFILFSLVFLLLFFFNDTATTEIYTLSLHDALPIFFPNLFLGLQQPARIGFRRGGRFRSEEHTSELQSPSNLVWRLLLGKKQTKGGKPAQGRRPPPPPRAHATHCAR